MQTSPFTRAFLLMFSGPLIWGAHFLGVYVFAALACARHFAQVEWLGIGVVQWAVSVLTITALAAMGAILAVTRRAAGDDEGDNARFVRWTTFTLGALSMLAVVWAAIPAYLVRVCD